MMIRKLNLRTIILILAVFFTVTARSEEHTSELQSRI